MNFRLLKLLSFGLLHSWTFGLLDFGASGLLDFWTLGLLDFWTCGLFGFWAFGRWDFGTLGLLGSWTFGFGAGSLANPGPGYLAARHRLLWGLGRTSCRWRSQLGNSHTLVSDLAIELRACMGTRCLSHHASDGIKRGRLLFANHHSRPQGIVNNT